MKTEGKQTFASVLSVAMAIILLFTYGWPGLENADAKSHADVSKSLHKAQVPSKNKVDKALTKQFKKHDQVTFLVKFKDQVNTKKIAKNALAKKQKKKTTAAKAEVMKRSVIVSALRSKSFETQYHVKDFLKRQKKAGKIKDYHSYYIVNAMAVTGSKDVAEKLSKMGGVEKVLPNRTRQLTKNNHAKAKKSSSKKKASSKTKTSDDDDDAVEPNVEHIHAPQVWDMGFDGTGLVVGSLDSGVQWDHPALKEKYRGYDPDHPDNPNNEFNWLDAIDGKDAPSDDIGHGTHTTGTMVGSEANGSNQIGVAPGAQWIAAKAFGGSDGTGSDADILAAGEWMLAPKDAEGNPHPEMAPDVINNSWGGGAGKDEFFREMVKNWREAGIFPAFAAGNIDDDNPGGPGSVASPGNYPESFAVGATNNDDELADFSLRGPSPYDEIKPDIAAPGVNIRSSVPGSDYQSAGYSGTSMATPLVTGTIALLRQADASLSVDELEDILLDTSQPLTDEEYPDTPNNGYGHGGLQAHNAVDSVISGLGKIEGQVSKESKSKTKEKTQTLPMPAKVSVLETGSYVNTDPTDGRYSLHHPAGTYTLKAESYGFYSKTQSVKIPKDGTAATNFTLRKIPKGTVSGTITNKATGKPIEDATISLAEDAAISPVETDKDGNYSIEAYEGDYTMHVSAPQYDSRDVNITINGDDSITQNAKLKPFIAYPGEIGYDNGKVTNGSMYYAGRAGWAVKMSLPDKSDSAFVTEGLFQFIDKGFSDTRGRDFAVEVWDASGPEGQPGKKLAGPIPAKAVYDDWTIVDLSDQHIKVDGDFYMVYVQTMTYPTAPGLGTDDGNPYMGRSYQYMDGNFYPAFEEDGNYMIRARVSYDVEEPVITSPASEEIANEESITVEGTSSPNTTVQLINNKEKAGEVEVGDDGKFTIPLELSEGKNELTAVSLVQGTPADASDPVSVTLDTQSPELTIDNPQNRWKTNNMAINVKGTAKDENLDWVKVNGEKADLKDDGSYSHRILLDKGENKINVVSKDKAGNRSKETRTVFAKFDAPKITNLEPSKDQYLDAGESVIIEMDSEPGLKATFKILMPLANPSAIKTSSIDELPMMETSNGHYLGVWTATNNVKAEGAKIEVTAQDDYGNKTKKKAGGELFINVQGNNQVDDADDLDKRVKHYEESDESINDSASRMLHMHLTLVNRFEQKEMSDKVIKQLKGFKLLLKHEKNHKQISSKVYDNLKSGANELILKWTLK